MRWWSQLGGEHGRFDGANGASGGTLNFGTGAGGFDWKLSDRWMVGAGGGVGLRRAQFGRQGFAESGASALSLMLPEQTLTLRQADIKVHLWRRERDVRPFFEAIYRREMTSGRTPTRLEFAEVPGSAFTVEGLPVPGHTVAARGGVTLLTWLGAWTFEYQARHSPGQFAQSADLRVRFK